MKGELQEVLCSLARWTEPRLPQAATIPFSSGICVEACGFLPYIHANFISSRMISLSLGGSHNVRPCLNIPYFILLFQMESGYQGILIET